MFHSDRPHKVRDSDSSIQFKANCNDVFCAVFSEQSVLSVNTKWKSLELKALCIVCTEESFSVDRKGL